MNYFLVADSGSTKTDWALVDSIQGELMRFTTIGLNPFFVTENEMTAVLKQVINKLETFSPGKVAFSSVYFYGAGCIPEKIAIVKEQIESQFLAYSLPRIEVQCDLLGAARALCGKQAGIACILGTGSNSCYYDGNAIRKQVSSLGYILGDEGSGAVLGKILLGDLLKNQLPEELRKRFEQRFGLSPADIIERVYRQPFPNRFLASFSPFIYENLSYPAVRSLVVDAFTAFFRRNILQYKSECSSCEVHFTGSVAYHYQELLREVAELMGFQIGNILSSPLDGLIRYHISDPVHTNM